MKALRSPCSVSNYLPASWIRIWTCKTAGDLMDHVSQWLKQFYHVKPEVVLYWIESFFWQRIQAATSHASDVTDLFPSHHHRPSGTHKPKYTWKQNSGIKEKCNPCLYRVYSHNYPWSAARALMRSWPLRWSKTVAHCRWGVERPPAQCRNRHWL